MFCTLAGGGVAVACSIPAVPGAARYFSGSCWNRSLQRGEQKKYVLPPCSTFSAAFCGSTIIPQTGSFTRGVLPRIGGVATTGFVPVPASIPRGGGAAVSSERNCSGACSNRVPHPALQK